MKGSALSEPLLPNAPKYTLAASSVGSFEASAKSLPVISFETDFPKMMLQIQGLILICALVVWS